MTAENWQTGYKETKNLIHNEVGLGKEELIEIFRSIARDEIKQIVEDNKPFIYATMKDVIRSEMIGAVNEHRYPKVNGHMRMYGHNGKGENSFQDFISGVMKEEIVKNLEEQFSVDINVNKK